MLSWRSDKGDLESMNCAIQSPVWSQDSHLFTWKHIFTLFFQRSLRIFLSARKLLAMMLETRTGKIQERSDLSLSELQCCFPRELQYHHNILRCQTA